MRAYEIPLKITSDGRLEIPDALIKSLAEAHTGRVLILIDETAEAEEKAAWSRVTAEQFLAGYGETDSVYDTI